jgi:hypothetical protein
MQSDDKIEPIDDAAVAVTRSLDEWEDIAMQILDVLQEQADSAWSEDWHPHCAQIEAAVTRFRDRCREASELITRSLSDEDYAHDLHEMLWREGDRLTKWLQRITG